MRYFFVIDNFTYMHSDEKEEFNEEMRAIVDRAQKECRYKPTMLLRMIEEHGAIQAAINLVSNDKHSDGFITLWEAGRLDLTVEALVCAHQFKNLFSEEVLKKAADKLRKCNYEV